MGNEEELRDAWKDFGERNFAEIKQSTGLGALSDAEIMASPEHRMTLACGYFKALGEGTGLTPQEVDQKWAEARTASERGESISPDLLATYLSDNWVHGHTNLADGTPVEPRAPGTFERCPDRSAER